MKYDLNMISKATQMKELLYITLLSIALICPFIMNAQTAAVRTHADSTALEGVIVEVYHKATNEDCADTLGGKLPAGSITYRIYIDLKPEYSLQVVYGSSVHELRIATTSTFYNNTYCGALVGYNVNYAKLNTGNYSLDSWITLNSASNHHAGILLVDDKDGSVLWKKGFEKADGFTEGNLPVFKPFNIDLNFFNWIKDPSVFTVHNGGWAALSGTHSGTKGPTPDNRILIAQLTTTGELSFQLNIQVGAPSGEAIQFVAKNPEGNEIKGPGLEYKQSSANVYTLEK
jgi:hypothetical protein